MIGLEELYREVILDHYRSPRNRGELEAPPARRLEGFNPLCGDEVVVYVALDDDGVLDVAIGGQGCSISQSSASLMSTAVKGRPIREARRLVASFAAMLAPSESEGDGELLRPEELGELAAMQGVAKFPVRIKCATLSWQTLARALDELESPEEGD